MVRGAVVLREVIGKVYGTGGPIYIELALFDSVAEPIETHVDCFRALLLARRVENAIGRAVVGFQWCWRLNMAELVKSGT